MTLRWVSPPAGPWSPERPWNSLASAEGAKKVEMFFRFEPSTEVSFSLGIGGGADESRLFRTRHGSRLGPLPWTGTAPSAFRNRSK